MTTLLLSWFGGWVFVCGLFNALIRGAVQLLLHTSRASVDIRKVMWQTPSLLRSLGSLLFEEDIRMIGLGLLTILHLLSSTSSSNQSATAQRHDAIFQTTHLLKLTQHPSVAVSSIACHVLAALMQQSEALASEIASTPETVEIFCQLIGTGFSSKLEEAVAHLRLFDGSGCGLSSYGVLDGILALMLQCTKAEPMCAERFLSSSCWSRLWNIVLATTVNRSVTDKHAIVGILSPAGTDLLVSLMYHMFYSFPQQFTPHFLNRGERTIAFLASLVGSEQLSTLEAWPKDLGGGAGGVHELVLNVAKLFYLPLAHSLDEATRDHVDQMYTKERLVLSLTKTSQQHLPPALFSIPMGLVAQLVLDSDLFAEQFMASVTEMGSEGSSFFADLLNITQPVDFLVDMAAMISTLARSSARNYPFLNRVGVVAPLVRLLRHQSHAVRGKFCNALGNLFRHSAYFYKFFDKCGSGVECRLKYLLLTRGGVLFQRGWRCSTRSLPL
eukprot:m.242033 g.242033  ORF g.242033 m.242033 type:complete len:498 (+) comp10940_c2_seq17:2219-3712(+)